MSDQRDSGHVENQACEWALRIDAGPLDADAAARLDAWLAENHCHGGALLRARAALSFLDRGRALSGVVPMPQRIVRYTRRELLWAGGGLAAAAAGLGVFGLLESQGRRFATAVGELRRVPLPDGSVASINTQTLVEVAIRPGLRQINLDRGEAWFQVAKDSKRPFLVAAGKFRVQAVGTAFSVRRRARGADVLVTEGTVEAWMVGVENHRAQLSAGSQAFLSDAGTVKVAESGSGVIRRTLAWRDGQIALEGESVADAAEEFNRYNSRKIVITDPDLAREPLVGQFRTSEPEAFARAVGTALGATVREVGSSIQLSRERPSG